MFLYQIIFIFICLDKYRKNKTSFKMKAEKDQKSIVEDTTSTNYCTFLPVAMFARTHSLIGNT